MLRQVGHRYRVGGPWVLRDVELVVPEGALVRVVGGNGTGKSTLLRVLAGVCQPTRGRVLGRPSTGYVPERFPPALPIPIADYLAHLGRVRGLRGAALRRQVDEGLACFGITDIARTSFRELSKGTCQKVAVAQALLAEPRLLVLDEAWTGLDQPTRALVDDLVLDRRLAGATVVFVDHDPTRMAGHVDVSWRVADGRVGAATDDVMPSSGRVVAIDVSGYPEDGPDILDLPGLVGLLPMDDVVRLRVRAEVSDMVLRTLLAVAESVHVRGVREEPMESELVEQSLWSRADA
jgi:ABC-type Mn2+/Zn2+ transport system ATPase subunit